MFGACGREGEVLRQVCEHNDKEMNTRGGNESDSEARADRRAGGGGGGGRGIGIAYSVDIFEGGRRVKMQIYHHREGM